MTQTRHKFPEFQSGKSVRTGICTIHVVRVKGGAYSRPRMVARVVTTLQLFAAETCNKFLKIEHYDSIVYSKHELILAFLAGATSDFTAGNTTQERLDLPARFLQQILILPYFT